MKQIFFFEGRGEGLGLGFQVWGLDLRLLGFGGVAWLLTLLRSFGGSGILFLGPRVSDFRGYIGVWVSCRGGLCGFFYKAYLNPKPPKTLNHKPIIITDLEDA